MLCLSIWISKLYALYQSHAVWADAGVAYVALAALISSWQEILVAAALALLFHLGGRMLAGKPRARRLVDAVILLLAAAVVILNYVNAELLAKLGTPLTVPLIHYSDLLASEHGRSALWAWTGSGFLLLGLAIVVAVLAIDWIVRRLLDRVPRPATLFLLVAGTIGLALAGNLTSPAAPNQEQSGTVALVRSLHVLGGGLPESDGPVEPPFALGGVATGLQRPAGEVRNVILIVLEAAAAGYLDQYGGGHDVTPNLTALAPDSIVVRNAYAQSASSTVALATLLSARYPPVSPLAASETTAVQVPLLPAMLSRAGLRTGFFHSSDTRFHEAGAFLDRSGFGTVRDYRHRRCDDRLFEDRYSSLGNADRCTFADLTRWIDEEPRQPFFATLWTFQTHYPYFSQAAGGDRQRYLGAIAEADRLIGELVAHLKRTGRYDETLIVVTADHGQAFGEHGSFGNGLSLYEESVRIPLILIHPGFARQRPFERLSGQIDIAPTILDALRMEVPRGWDGVSLFADSPERPIHFVNSTADLVLGYRVGDRKTIWNLVRGTTEIYDLAADPAERNDLADEVGDDRIAHEQAWLAAWAGEINRRGANSN